MNNSVIPCDYGKHKNFRYYLQSEKKTRGSYVHRPRNFPLSNKLYFQSESFSDGSSGGLPLVVYTIKLTLHLDWSLGVSYNSYMHIQTSPSFHLPARSDTSASPLRSSRHKNNQLPPPLTTPLSLSREHQPLVTNLSAKPIKTPYINQST